VGSSQQYRQCVFKKYNDDGSVLHHHAYIPSQFAKLNKTISVKIGEVWYPRFLVTYVGPVCTIEDIDDKRHDDKRFKWVLGE
jgi:hypothetical protein